jgi:hypothetical protein
VRAKVASDNRGWEWPDRLESYCVADVILLRDRKEDRPEHVLEINEYGKYQLMKAGLSRHEVDRAQSCVIVKMRDFDEY